MERHAQPLADAIEAAIPTWVVRCVTTVMVAWQGAVPPDVQAAAEDAGQAARADAGAAVRVLLEADIDEQRGTPLALLRAAVRYPTAVLSNAGVPPVERDRFAEEAFPRDVYDLTPASLADIDPDLADLGIAWGAAKAMEHRRRHGS
ncbi:MAG TPA: hypothetical protein VKV25_07425 [Acidimicrobiales bacterium]|nr:hypothetical protein [Acidimicrobiales bacterium]